MRWMPGPLAMSVSTAFLALDMSAQAYEIVYNPAGGPGIYTNLQAACDVAAQTNAVTSVRLEADWNSPLTITNRHTGSNWNLDASDGDPRIASRLTIADSIIPANHDEGKLQVLGGWIGIARETNSVQDQAPVTVGAANVCFVGVRFAGRDVRHMSAIPPCGRVGSGGLVELTGHADSDLGNDIHHGLFAGFSIYGSTDFIDCTFDFFFTAVGDCPPAEGALASAIQATNAKLRVANAQIPTGGATRFVNGFVHAEESLVYMVDTQLDGLTIVPGGAADHPAPFLTASGTLLDGGDDFQRPRQVVVMACEVTNSSGAAAGAVHIDDVRDEGDYSGVSIYGPCTFEGCSGELAGALRLTGCTVQEISTCDFLNNTCSLTQSDGAGAVWIENQVGNTVVSLHTCAFQDNTAGTAAGAALRVDDTPLNLHHSQFADNTGYGVMFTAQVPKPLTIQDLVLDAGQVWPRPAGLRLAMPGKTGARVDNLLVSGYTKGLELDLAAGETGARLLVDGLTTDVPSTGIDVLDLDSGLDLKNVNLKAFLGVNTTGPNNLLTLRHVNCDDCATFVGGQYQQYASEHLTQHESQFVGTGDVVEAHQLKWSSPLLDIGVGTGTGSQELLDYDYDVTARDIGHKRRFTPETLSGSHTDKPVGWYQVAANSSAQLTWTDALPHGTVVRAAQGAVLEITAAGGGTFSFGSDQGERTAIVPRNAIPGHEYQRAARLVLSGVQGEILDFHGVLLNGIAEDWQFDNVTATLDYDAGPSSIDFDFAQDAQHDEPTILGFTDCAGEVSGFSFLRNGLGTWPLSHLGTLRSSVSITDCDFDVPDATAGYALAMEGRKAGVASTISECTFSGNATSGYPIKLIDAQPRLAENIVSDIRTYGLHCYLSAPTLDHTARNHFLSELDDQDLHLSRLVFLHDSPAWLECGENSFIYDWIQTEPLFDYIYYKGKQPVPVQGGNDITNYHLNFWGRDCSTPVSTTGRVPTWANTGTELPGCPGGLPLACADVYHSMRLLTEAGETEAAGNLAGAAATYTELIATYPDSPAAHSAAQRLKAIAFDGSLDLQPADFAALAATVQESVGLVPAYLMGAAECLRAWQGDAAAAAANLDAQQAAATDESEELLAQKNRLEIETYPPSGGLARRGQAPRSQEARQARERFLAFDPETSTPTSNRVEDTTRPGGPELLGAWPNPFNPATTLVLHLPEAAPLRVTVHNLAGQRAATLHQGQVSAGEHRYTWLAEGAASGIYLLRAETPTAVAQQKILLLK